MHNEIQKCICIPYALKPVLETTCIKQSTALRDNFSDTILLLNPLPDNNILDRSKLKQSADDSFKFDENSRKRVENNVGKGEIACYVQFLLFPVFSKGLLPGASKGVIVWEWVKSTN